MNHRWNCYRGLRRQDIPVIAALPLVSLPFLVIQGYWYGPSDRLLNVLTSHFRLSADGLTAMMSGIYLALFSLMLLVGHLFLRRFLEPVTQEAE